MEMTTLYPEDWEEKEGGGLDFLLWLVAGLIPIVVLLVTDIMMSGQ